MSVRLTDGTIASVTFHMGYTRIFYFSLNKSIKLASSIELTTNLVNAIYNKLS